MAASDPGSRSSAAGQHLGLGGLEGADELPADDLALLLGLGDAGERVEELLLGVHDVQVDARRGHEVALDLLGLALAQQAVVDEDAGEPVTDRALHHRGRHGGVDAAGEPADRVAGLADLLADALGLLVDDVDHRPGLPAAGDPVQEVLQDGLAVLGVQHLGVPLDAGQAPVEVLERRDRGRLRGGQHVEARRGRADRVAVRHPDGVRVGQLGEEHAGGGDLHPGAAVLARARCARPRRPGPGPSAGSRSTCRRPAPARRRCRRRCPAPPRRRPTTGHR